MENKKYTVLLGQGDKTIENYKFDNLNVAKVTASAFTLDDKYDTVALEDNETGKFIHFDPKEDLTNWTGKNYPASIS